MEYEVVVCQKLVKMRNTSSPFHFPRYHLVLTLAASFLAPLVNFGVIRVRPGQDMQQQLWHKTEGFVCEQYLFELLLGWENISESNVAYDLFNPQKKSLVILKRSACSHAEKKQRKFFSNSVSPGNHAEKKKNHLVTTAPCSATKPFIVSSSPSQVQYTPVTSNINI